MKKGLLAVSFGTSVGGTREKTIDAIEKDLQGAFPDFWLYRAWTSGRIVRKLRERDGVCIDTVAEAMERMRLDRVEELLVQPTHVLDGVENDRMKEDVLAFESSFRKIRFGKPLLAVQEDFREVVRALMEEYQGLPADEALMFVGHGTAHQANAAYAALDTMFKAMGFPNVFLGTVEACPSPELLAKRARACGAKRVTLAPFLVVAGEHARNDICGDGEDSWKNRLEEAGFTVNCVLRGLGEYEGIRKIYVEHARAASGQE